MWKGNKSIGDNKVVFATEVYQEQTIALAVSNTSGSNNSISCEMIRPNTRIEVAKQNEFFF